VGDVRRTIIKRSVL